MFRNNADGPRTVEKAMRGRTITGFGRRGKYLWMTTEEPEDSLVIHLGMSGQVRYFSGRANDDPEARRKHEHLRLDFLGGGGLSFVDPRTFGHLTVSPLALGADTPVALQHVAPDPFETIFDLEGVAARGQSSRRLVKNALLDQTLLSGSGNIYADEGLHRAGIWGATRGNQLDRSQWRTVVEACTDAMAEALKVGGTSFDSLYVDVEGNPGYFSRALRVYGRDGKPCPTCGSLIVREVLSGRSHFYCPRCQTPLAESPISKGFHVS